MTPNSRGLCIALCSRPIHRSALHKVDRGSIRWNLDPRLNLMERIKNPIANLSVKLDVLQLEWKTDKSEELPQFSRRTAEVVDSDSHDCRN